MTETQVTTLDRLPAAVVQKKAHPARSERYVHINTHDIIKVMEGEGFKVAQVQVTKSKHRDPLYARHLVDLRRDELTQADGTVPRFLFTNSHDGSTGAAIMLGAYRFVCSNGLVVGTSFARERVRHTGDAATDLINKVKALAKNTAPLFEQMEAWQRKELTVPQARKFAELASVLRWGDPHRFPADEVLKVRREADERPTLWNVFNRVQENAMRGGLIGLSATGRRATSRPLSDIVATTEFNAKLWSLATEFATV